MSNKTAAAAQPTLTTFYDGACPYCRPEIEHYKRLGRRAGKRLAWCDVSRHPDALALFGIDGEAAQRRLHVLDQRGTLHDGIDAFAALWAELPSYRWLAQLVELPVVHRLAATFYDRGVAATVDRLKRRREARRRVLD